MITMSMFQHIAGIVHGLVNAVVSKKMMTPELKVLPARPVSDRATPMRGKVCSTSV